MCVQIDSRCVIFNLLQAMNAAPFASLQRFVVALKAKFPGAYVDISDASVLAVIDDNSGLLRLEGDTISRGQSFGKFDERDFLDLTINRNFPPTLKEILRDVATSLAAG